MIHVYLENTNTMFASRTGITILIVSSPENDIVNVVHVTTFLHSVNHAVSATIACSFQTGVTCKQELQEIIVRVSQMNESLVGTFPCLVCYFLSYHAKSDIPEESTEDQM